MGINMNVFDYRRLLPTLLWGGRCIINAIALHYFSNSPKKQTNKQNLKTPRPQEFQIKKTVDQ